MSNPMYKDLLMPLQGKAENKFKVFGFDVETYKTADDFTRKNGKHIRCDKQDFYMGSIVGDNDFKKVFYDKNEMCDYLLGRQTRDSFIVATNLEFDFNILFYDRLKDFHLIYRSGLLAAIKRDGIHKHTFTDSLNYIKSSVANLGKMLGCEKGKQPDCLGRLPNNYSEKLELEKYNVNDSYITYLFAKHFKDFCTQHNMKMKLTIGSTGMDYWRRNHQFFPMKREPDHQIVKHFDGSFRGGMTQVFKRGTYNDKMWYFDYRSSYPSVMVDGFDKHGSYPDPSSYKFSDKPSTDMIESYPGICKCSIKAPYMYMPLLGVKNDKGKLLFPYGNFDGWFTNEELKIAMNYGYEVDPEEMIYYTSTFKPFREAIKYLYDLRKMYKKDNHPYQAMVKTLMNSGLFGKWGTNFLNMEELIPLDDITFGSDGRAYHKDKLIEEYNANEMYELFDGFCSIKKEGKPMRYSFPILSSYTTMMGRMKLWKDIQKHKDSVVYTDTDSAVTTKPVFDEGCELGDWELEHNISKGVFIKPKFYMLKADGNTICKSKGIGHFINSESDFIKAVGTGKVDMNRFTKMKESNRLKIKSGSIIELSKHISTNDDKRDWLGQRFKMNCWQSSEPLKMIDGVDQFTHEKLLRTSMDQYERSQESLLSGDFFDSKGDDVTNKEFLENEMFFER